MFGIGFSELILIAVVALIVLGPEKLPQAANQIGKLMGILRKNSDSLKREFYNSVYTPAEDIKNRIDISQRELFSLGEKDPEFMNCEEKEKLNNQEKNQDNFTNRLSANNSDKNLAEIPKSENLTEKDKGI